MSATRYDGPFRYQVDSESRHGIKHLVEIDAYENNGACACEHFTMRLETVCKQPAFQPSEDTRCKHIKEARNQFINDVIAVVKDRVIQNGDGDEPPA